MSFVDAEARAEILQGTGAHMFVEAGAGTGKTTAMVGRIVGLIADGRATIDTVVAITFTEAAAGELRERLRVALEKRRATAGGEESARCQQALIDLESAAIQTIHAFANRIVSRFAVDIGIPPSFEVQDRIQAKLDERERWNSYLRRVLLSMDGFTEDEKQAVRVGTALGLNHGHLSQLVDALQRRWYGLTSMVDEPQVPWQPFDTSALFASIDAVEVGLRNCRDDQDLLLRWTYQTLAPWVAEVRSAAVNEDPLVLLETLGRAPSMKVGNKGAKGKWVEGCLADQRELVLNLAETRLQVLDQPRRWALRSLVRMLARYVVGEATHRRVSGQLSFDDLLFYATELVRVDEVATLLRQTYRYLFVDEFQDTDGLQVELVNALVKNAGDLDGAELFTVGDPKQSIYRFRGADLAQFQAVRQTKRAEIKHLTTNFRTVESVVAWVNAGFETLLADAGSWTPLTTSRCDALGGVQVIGDVVEDMRARDVREIEAAEVVDRLVAAKEQGWLIDDNGVPRTIKYGDMALLMPTRRSLPSLERELRRAQVPYRVESRSLIWITQEIRDLTAILKAVSNPRDEVALVAALRSAAFGCGDDDLYRWSQTDGVWNYQVPLIDEASPVAQAFLRLKALHDRHQWLPVSQFVSEVVAELRMYELAFARPRQREAWHRLRFAVDRARAWTDDGGSGLHGFVQWIETQEREAADAIETVVPEADDDAVRLMTIHASKGLEFPLVAVVGLGSKDSVTNSARLLWNADGTYEARIGDKDLKWQTASFTDASDADVAFDEAEQARLLYVAVTRARDHLLVSLYRQKRSAEKSLAGRLAACLALSDGVSMPAAQPNSDAASVIGSALTVVDPADTRLRRASVIKQASRQLSFSATAIATRSVGIDDVLPSFAAGSEDVDANDLAERLAFGSAVHSALEVIALDAHYDEIDTVAQYKAMEFGLTHRAADIGRSISSALGSHHVRRALSSGRWWREVPVYTAVGETVFGGTIDLLYEQDGELVVADYKTEEVKDDAARQHAVERYKWQLVTYAAVCEQTTGKKVREANLLFIAPSTDNALSIAIEPLDQLIERLKESVLPGISAGPSR